MNHLSYKLVTTEQELLQAQQLRHEVFNVEMKSQQHLPFEASIDVDSFDPICDHLIIVDNLTNTVIGTYRLLMDNIARKHFGFYTETKFDISAFKKLDGNLLEVGRSCVHKDYRNHIVMNLLWQGIAQYAIAHKVHYIFGSANIMTDDVFKISQYFQMFKDLNLYENYDVKSVDDRHRIDLEGNIFLPNPMKFFMQLPTLFKAYMKVGIKVCGYPSKGDFQTALFPVLLDIKKTNKSYKRRFFGDYLDSSFIEERFEEYALA